MQVNFYNIKSNYKQPAFKNVEKDYIKKAENDSFSILDKYNERFKHSYVKDIIPDLREYIKSSGAIKENEIKGILGQGGLSIIFDIGKNVLKCSLENPLEYRKHNPEFDIPFLSPVVKVNKTYIVKEAKADTNNLTVEDCKDVISRIKNAGLELSSDMDEYKTRQIGRYNGKVYLLDTRCAVPRPNAFSRWVYDFCKNHRRVFFAKDMSIEALDKYETEMLELAKKYGPYVFHVKEAPRKNLSLYEGFSMIWKIMKENMKYRKFPL